MKRVTEAERDWERKGEGPDGVRPRTRWRDPERRGVGSRAPGLP